jgi:hypothetical protein
MTQENRTQETPTPALEPGELTAAELAHVVGGTDGPPAGSGTGNIETARLGWVTA